MSKDPLNLSSKLAQKTVRDTIGRIDWKRGSDAPFIVELDPTSACNLACPDCISRELLNKGGFTKARFRELVTELVDLGVKAVVLIGGGEPLAHPEIGWAIEYFGNNGVKLGLTTNGLLIDRYLDIIAEHTSWTRISMDAGTRETFGRIRPDHSGHSQFDRALENMEKLGRTKKGKLGYSYMIYSPGKFDPRGKECEGDTFTNVGEIFEAARIAKDLNCDYIEIKPMYDINHYAINQGSALMVTLKAEIEKSLKLESESFRILLASKLGAILNGEGNVEPKNYTRCAVSQLRTLITPSGVYVCPYFRGNQSKKIGDVTTTSLKEIWHGEQRARVMAALNPSIDCRMHCIRHDSNLTLEDMIAGNSQVATIDDYDLFI